MLIRSRRAVMGLSTLGVGAMLLLSGCDFWPPALQAQIEQLHSEAQQAAADKALLQNQLNAANKAKEELQIRVEDLTRVNKEKSAMIANLEHTIAGRKISREEVRQADAQARREVLGQVPQHQENKTCPGEVNTRRFCCRWCPSLLLPGLVHR